MHLFKAGKLRAKEIQFTKAFSRCRVNEHWTASQSICLWCTLIFVSVSGNDPVFAFTMDFDHIFPLMRSSRKCCFNSPRACLTNIDLSSWGPGELKDSKTGPNLGAKLFQLAYKRKAELAFCCLCVVLGPKIGTCLHKAWRT